MGIFSIHYANSKTIDSDFEKDMNLPFKSNINLISFDLLALPISYVTKEITCIDLNENNGIIAYKNNFIHASLLSNIWQPHAWHAENTVKSFPAEVLIYKYLTQLFVVR